ncbi:MAG TPA: RsmD family RNA methyltransferase [Actinomycetota bacterium]|nr:RsmD family RNA methyltransferase [Actinomycetota bacterium]
MRVIAGSAKGTRLGPVPRGVRPVSDRVREGLFSSLGDAVDSARVLDVFAGTGALGIEALSRGAAHARFVDRGSASIRAIRENLRRTRLEDRATITHGEALATLMDDDNSSGPGYDLVLADPPYEHPLESVSATLAALAGGRLRSGGTCVLTRPTRSSTPVIPLHWGVSRRLEYGDTAVLILREA